LVYLKPKISIIIPTFNSEAAVGDAIKSVINQSYKNFEILIIDSDSLDNTVKIVQAFGGHNVRIFSEKDKGVYEAMNKGLDLALGDWVYFLGSDDIFYDNQVLQIFIDEAEQSKAKVYYGNVLIKGNTPWAKDKTVYDGEFNWEKLKSKNISHQAIFYNLNYLNEIKMRYDLNYPVCSDWDFNLRLWLKTEFVYFDVIVAVFTSGGLSTMSSDSFFEVIENKFALPHTGSKNKSIKKTLILFIQKILKILN